VKYFHTARGVSEAAGYLRQNKVHIVKWMSASRARFPAIPGNALMKGLKLFSKG